MGESANATIKLAELPAQPTGWTRRLIMHLNFGRGKHSATYTIHDEQGRRVEGIGYGYAIGGLESGFFLTETPGSPPSDFLTWAQLCEAYRAAGSASAGTA